MVKVVGVGTVKTLTLLSTGRPVKSGLRCDCGIVFGSSPTFLSPQSAHLLPSIRPRLRGQPGWAGRVAEELAVALSDLLVFFGFFPFPGPLLLYFLFLFPPFYPLLPMVWSYD